MLFLQYYNICRFKIILSPQNHPYFCSRNHPKDDYRRKISRHNKVARTKVPKERGYNEALKSKVPIKGAGIYAAIIYKKVHR